MPNKYRLYTDYQHGGASQAQDQTEFATRSQSFNDAYRRGIYESLKRAYSVANEEKKKPENNISEAEHLTSVSDSLDALCFQIFSTQHTRDFPDAEFDHRIVIPTSDEAWALSHFPKLWSSDTKRFGVSTFSAQPARDEANQLIKSGYDFALQELDRSKKN